MPVNHARDLLAIIPRFVSGGSSFDERQLRQNSVSGLYSLQRKIRGGITEKLKGFSERIRQLALTGPTLLGLDHQIIAPSPRPSLPRTARARGERCRRQPHW